MKRMFTRRTLGLTILWLSGPLLLFAIIYPVFKRAEETRSPSSCQGNLKEISLGVLQYTQDYDERYPLVDVNDTGISDSNPYGWADALQPYLKSTQIFQCPSEVTSIVLATSGPFNGQADPTAKNYTDYWYNARLNGLEQKKRPPCCQHFDAGRRQRRHRCHQRALQPESITGSMATLATAFRRCQLRLCRWACEVV